MSSAKSVSSFLSFAGARFSPRGLLTLLMTPFLLSAVTPIEARPICDSVFPLPLDQWIEVAVEPAGGRHDQKVFAVTLDLVPEEQVVGNGNGAVPRKRGERHGEESRSDVSQQEGRAFAGLGP